MPRPTHRLDLYLVPRERPPPGAGTALLTALAALGVLTDGGGPGPRARELVAGGFGRVRFDDPGTEVLYANQLGGFRVTCPARGANVVPAFQAALQLWRAGGARSVACPECGAQHDLAELDFAPPAAFGFCALVVADAGDRVLRPDAAAEIEAALGRCVLVWRRPFR